MVSERVQDWIDKVSIHGGEMILVRDLKELLEENAIVHREIRWGVLDGAPIIEAGRDTFHEGVSMYDTEIANMYNAFIRGAELI